MSHNFEGAPCVGRWSIFDSLDADDHATARTLCQTCPHIEPCRNLLAEHRGDWACRPQGTWAGVMVGRVPSACGSESGYKQHQRLREETCQPCRDAHAAYNRALYAAAKGAAA